MFATITFIIPDSGKKWTTDFRAYADERHLDNYIAYMERKKGWVYDEHRLLQWDFSLGDFLFKVLDVTHVRMFSAKTGNEIGWGMHVGQFSDREWYGELRDLVKSVQR